MNHTSLRIKKFYFDQIRSGEKKIEFRKNTEFYRRLFSKKIETLTLHYQRRERLKVKVRRICLIDRPKRFESESMLPTPKIFAIVIDRVLEHRR